MTHFLGNPALVLGLFDIGEECCRLQIYMGFILTVFHIVLFGFTFLAAIAMWGRGLPM